MYWYNATATKEHGKAHFTIFIKGVVLKFPVPVAAFVSLALGCMRDSAYCAVGSGSRFRVRRTNQKHRFAAA
eukprot:scaffold109422_cov43-Attheya_sp.AAC.1